MTHSGCPIGYGLPGLGALWVLGPSLLTLYPVRLMKELLKCLGASELIGYKGIKLTYLEILNCLQNKPTYFWWALLLAYSPPLPGNRKQIKLVAIFLVIWCFFKIWVQRSGFKWLLSKLNTFKAESHVGWNIIWGFWEELAWLWLLTMSDGS